MTNETTRIISGLDDHSKSSKKHEEQVALETKIVSGLASSHKSPEELPIKKQEEETKIVGGLVEASCLEAGEKHSLIKDPVEGVEQPKKLKICSTSEPIAIAAANNSESNHQSVSSNPQSTTTTNTTATKKNNNNNKLTEFEQRKRITSLKEQIRKYQLVKRYREMNCLNGDENGDGDGGRDLESLTSKWKQLCRDVLRRMATLMPASTDDYYPPDTEQSRTVNDEDEDNGNEQNSSSKLLKLMKSFGIDPDLLSYDRENDDFIDD